MGTAQYYVAVSDNSVRYVMNLYLCVIGHILCEFMILVFTYLFAIYLPGRVAQTVGHLTRKSEFLGRYPVWPLTFVSPPAHSREAVVSYWRKYVHEILVNRLGGLNLPRKSVTVPT